MRKALRPLVWSALLSIGLAGCAQDKGIVKAKLQSEALQAPEAVLSAPDAADRLSDGIVMPAKQPASAVSISGTAKHEATIAGTKLVITIPDEKTFALRTGEKSFKLEPIGDTRQLKPILLPLADTRAYHLAFPYGMIYTAPDNQGAREGFLFYRAGGVQKFTLDGQTVSIYDHNTDGFYRPGEDTLSTAPVDGPINVFVGFKKLVATRSSIYELQSLAADGSEMELKKLPDATGKIATAIGLPDGRAKLALGSADAGLSFTIAGHDRKGMAALPGRYAIQGGLVWSSGLKKAVATMGPGRMKAIEVAAGDRQVIALGEPFALTFEVQKDAPEAGKVTIHSRNMHLYGKAGEEYLSFKWQSEPEIALASGTKVVPVGKMEFG